MDDGKIETLTFKDIETLKKCIDNQVDTIEDLVRERDQYCDANFDLRTELSETRKKLEIKEKEIHDWEARATGLRSIADVNMIPIANKVLFCLGNPRYKHLSEKFTEKEVYDAKSLLFSVCGGTDSVIGDIKVRKRGKKESKKKKDVGDIINALNTLDCKEMPPLLVITKEELTELERQKPKWRENQLEPTKVKMRGRLEIIALKL